MTRVVDRTGKDAEKAERERTTTMSAAGAPVPAPALRIKLRETGGIRGLELTVALEGNTVRVIDAGQVRLERQVSSNVVRAFADRVRALESIQPRRTYGHYGYTSDILTTQLEILDDSNGLEVEVVSDPRDPAPSQFWEIVNGLRKLTKTDVHATAFDF
jgi:hypothetical protein